MGGWGELQRVNALSQGPSQWVSKAMVGLPSVARQEDVHAGEAPNLNDIYTRRGYGRDRHANPPSVAVCSVD